MRRQGVSGCGRRVVVTGSDGQLGRFLYSRAGASAGVLQGELEWVFLNRVDADITRSDSLAPYLSEGGVEAVINCAAYTAVDAAEGDEAGAERVNGTGPARLAEQLSGGEYLVQISTDYVFGGSGNRPYRPDDVVHPVGSYARSKRTGEVAVLGYERGVVVRTGWLYSFGYSGFVGHVVRAVRGGGRMRVVYDQVGCPTWAGWLAEALVGMVEQGLEAGVWHATNRGAVSWYDFAVAINGVLGGGASIEPILSCEYPQRAERPGYSVLDSSATFLRYGEALSEHWYGALKRAAGEELGGGEGGDLRE